MDELEAAAAKAIEAMAFNYYAGGAETETTIAANRAAWEALRLRPMVLRDVSNVTTATSVLGTSVAAPILVAPTAYQRMAHPDGEAATARGAAAANTVMVVSTLATTSLEDVMAAAPEAPKWFQLYIFEDLGYAQSLLDRAQEAGYRAIVLTVDAPVLGYRPRDEIHNFRLPDALAMANLPDDVPQGDGSMLARLFASHNKGLTPDALGWIRERTGLPLVVKGIHRADDAWRCVEAGADAVVVSNHGGRQVDFAVATADALPEVVEAVGDRAEVYVDGGIRHGTDVLKALALGARAVLVGRPILWSLAAGGPLAGGGRSEPGAAGVEALLTFLRDMLHRTMTMSGVQSVEDVPRDLVTP
ncbi:MAG: alpha-hydroxy acid oxidase [Nitriliruptorales bacterium]|nr:alpha-hydroxy acid oxidase [Nitriliruptorales bacterium]